MRPAGREPDGEPRVYVVEPTGELEDWPRHSEQSVRAMPASLAELRRTRRDAIVE